jgi:hypothetical protein
MIKTWSFVTQIFRNDLPGDGGGLNLTTKNHWFSSFLSRNTLFDYYL